MKKLIITLLALAFTAAAQETPNWQQKIFDLKYADPVSMRIFIQGVMQSKDTRVYDSSTLRAISIGTRIPADLALAEELIKRYDVPRGAAAAGNRNIELIAYMLMAAPKGTAGDALPAELEPVAKQLKAVFGYNDFKLLDSALIRTREGVTAESSGNAGINNPNIPNATAFYQLRFKSALVSPSERGNLIKLDGFRFSIRVPVPIPVFQTSQGSTGASPPVPSQVQFTEVGFNTELDIREGQKVVVGKAKVDNTGSAFILVLTAKALD